MKETVMLLVIFSFFGLSLKANACPDLTGHYQDTVLNLTSDLKISQNGCVSAHVEMLSPAVLSGLLGVPAHLNLDSLLDGIARPQPPSPDAPNEADVVSTIYVGDVAVIIINRQYQDGTRQKIAIQAKLNGPQFLEMYKSNMDDQGKLSGTLHFEFTRLNESSALGRK